ncbi:hypothetical protein LshimejAT787_1600700 [Lyophyllum shimeji]|uniref:Uncharacterized protein n=1 Tax=Lyophyllum shimeji TaxID=47721 RepID=A0A9P3UTY4_LYOSH|nr:hypothetical protein LshimejAT787_1600700 [Lyophyllum shimeji]
MSVWTLGNFISHSETGNARNYRTHYRPVLRSLLPAHCFLLPAPAPRALTSSTHAAPHRRAYPPLPVHDCHSPTPRALSTRCSLGLLQLPGSSFPFLLSQPLFLHDA